MHEFEGNSAGDEKKAVRKIDLFDEAFTDNFIKGIVSADVFAKDE